jgi:hypothetical protein
MLTTVLGLVILVLSGEADKLFWRPYFRNIKEGTKGTVHGEEPLLHQAEAPQSLGETQGQSADRRKYGQNQGTRTELGPNPIGNPLYPVRPWQACRKFC